MSMRLRSAFASAFQEIKPNSYPAKINMYSWYAFAPTWLNVTISMVFHMLMEIINWVKKQSPVVFGYAPTKQAHLKNSDKYCSTKHILLTTNILERLFIELWQIIVTPRHLELLMFLRPIGRSETLKLWNLLLSWVMHNAKL